jgi:DnaD/phage-associated family protein
MNAFFNGFEESKKSFTGIPDQFFSEILPNIQNLNELKLILYLLWSAKTEGDYGIGFSIDEILQDKKFVNGLFLEKNNSRRTLEEALLQGIRDNILIEAGSSHKLYFLNTPRGRAGAEIFSSAGLSEVISPVRTTLDAIKPTLFRLYEENIGPLTPVIADMLKDAQNSYPADWIEDAVQIAVKNNVRRWKYVETILKRWKEEGRVGTDQRNTQEDYERYLKGEYGDIGKHW